MLSTDHKSVYAEGKFGMGASKIVSHNLSVCQNILRLISAISCIKKTWKTLFVL